MRGEARCFTILTALTLAAGTLGVGPAGAVTPVPVSSQVVLTGATPAAGALSASADTTPATARDAGRLSGPPVAPAATSEPGSSEARAARDAVRGPAPIVAGLEPEGLTVMEAAWGSEGSPALLHLVAVGVEPELAPGLTARLELVGKWGRDAAPFPSSQGLSSLDAEDFGGLGEAWVEWRMGNAVRLKAGRVDGNTEFAAAEVASTFANPSFGLSPALGLLPSYPTPAPSLNAFVRPVPGGPELGGGVYRTADGAWSAVGQLAGAAGQRFRWRAGLATPLGTGPVGGDTPSAGYLIVEGGFGEGGPSRGVSVFGKVATAGELLHLAGGLTAPLPGSAGTRAGVAGSVVTGAESADELVAEAFVAVRPASWLVVQPDAQLRLAPGSPPRVGALLRITVER